MKSSQKEINQKYRIWWINFNSKI